MSQRELLRRSWVANAAVWRDAVRGQRIESRRVVTDRAVLDAVLEDSPSTVLDLGCGEGWLSRALAAEGIAVTGIDASEPLIEAAQALGGAEFFVAAYDQLPPDRTFDTIVANFSLLDDRLPALPPHRRFIVQTLHPAFAGPPYTDGWRTEHLEGWSEPMPWYFRTLESWSRALAAYPRVDIREPRWPDRDVPASILFVCEG